MSAIIYPSWTPQTGYPVTQAAHGFTLGQQIYFDGTNWLLASAAAVQTLRVATVGQVVSPDQFLAVFEGVLQWPAHGFTLGAVYYLSDSVPGAVTPTAPPAAASFAQPCLKAITPDLVRVLEFVIPEPSVGSASPTGTVIGFGGTVATLPPGWLLCNGGEYAGTQYPDLFGVIGTLYGTPNQIGNFKVPDLRGRYVVMADHGSSRLSNVTSGVAPFLAEGALANDMTRMPRAGVWGISTAGAHTHTAQSAGAHTHSIDNSYRRNISGPFALGQTDPGGVNWSNTVAGNTGSAGAHTHGTDSQGNHTHTITGGDYQSRPESVVANYIIKT